MPRLLNTGRQSVMKLRDVVGPNLPPWSFIVVRLRSLGSCIDIFQIHEWKNQGGSVGNLMARQASKYVVRRTWKCMNFRCQCSSLSQCITKEEFAWYILHIQCGLCLWLWCVPGTIRIQGIRVCLVQTPSPSSTASCEVWFSGMLSAIQYCLHRVCIVKFRSFFLEWQMPVSCQ